MKKPSKTQEEKHLWMETQAQFLVLLLLSMVVTTTIGFGSMGSISGAYGEEDGFFCAIDASGKQEIICWKKNSSTSSTAAYFTSLPPMAALTGGAGFMCGLLSNTSQAYCWNSIDSGKNLVPQVFRFNAYSHIAAGMNHVCGVRGFYFSTTEDLGTVDCWEILIRTSKSSSQYVSKSSVFNTSVNDLVLRTIVAGEGFSCGGIRQGGIVCWGPKSQYLGVLGVTEKIVKLASGRDSICGILEDSGEVKCWGTKIDDPSSDPPVGTRFVALAAGLHHYCGIREDDHGIECWGNHNKSSVAKGEFLAISSSDFITCGVREDNLILYCWSAQGPSPSDYKPPLQLCSPGLCMSDSCDEGKFSFNASILGVPGLTNLCVKTELNICLPCGLNCSDGFFPSSVCDKNVDLVCTACSFCQNSSCWDVCGPPPSSSSSSQQQQQIKKLMIIIGSSVSGLTLFIIVWCLLPNKSTTREEEIQRKNQCSSCIGPSEVEVEMDTNPDPPLFLVPSASKTQVFRLSELKDATNGFKEFNEIGRGRYGFVYKAILSDGLQVAVKRANAATIIHSNSRDFEAELEVLCKVRHCNIVNLLGYCAEMGERLLVYEFMPHGTLHDHLHDHLSPLTWNLRLKISLQSARGLEYLHKDAVPPIIHRDVKTSNILLDSEWVARIVDFGLVNNERDLNGDEKSDVYSFGIVLLEILSGRKAYDNEYTPPDIVEWALPYIRQGKAAAIIDRNTPFPRSMEPLLKLAEIAERAVRKDPSERPIMSHVVLWLEQIVKGGLIS